MKLKRKIILFLLGIYFCLKMPAQLFNVDANWEGMSGTTFNLSPPTFNCPSNNGAHVDNGGFTQDKEKQKNHVQGMNWARSLRFIANFHSNCSYNLNDPDQLDWNKLMYILDPFSPFEANGMDERDFTSVRLGFRYNNTTNKMDLALYGHIRHVSPPGVYQIFNPPVPFVGREFLFVNDVALGVDMEYELILGGAGMGVIAGYKGSYIKRRDLFNNGTFKTAFKKTAYFGGQKCPPHNMDITVYNITGDQHSNWENGACEKTFSRSFFYTGENITIEASTSITMSQQVYRGQYDVGNNPSVPLYNVLPTSHSLIPNVPPEVADREEVPWFEQDGERFVKVENGANIITRAGSEIALLPGFESVNGSNFEATIANWITCATWAGRTASSTGENELNTDTPSADDLPVNFDPSVNNNDKAGEANSILNKNSGYFGIFPNPNNGFFTVKREREVEGAYIEVCTNLGVIVQKHMLKSLDEKINMSSLASGIYTVYLYENGKAINYTKLIKN